jgi:uncharacterized protein (DUF1697 family)
VTVLTQSAAITAANPLLGVATNPSRLLVAIPSTAEDCRRLDAFRDQDWTPEAIAVGARAAYLWCPDGVLGGRLGGEVDRLLRDSVTTRNWNTITTLRDLALGAPG